MLYDLTTHAGRNPKAVTVDSKDVGPERLTIFCAAPSGQGESSIVPGQFDDAAEKGRDLIGELLDEVGDDGGERDEEM